MKTQPFWGLAYTRATLLSLVLAICLQSQAMSQTTTDDSAAQGIDSGVPQATTDPTQDAAQPILPDPPKKQNQLQAVSLNGAPGGSGDPAIPGVSERVPGMAKVESSGAASYGISIIVPSGIVAPKFNLPFAGQGTRHTKAPTSC